MQGSIAQTVALTTYGNLFLQRPADPYCRSFQNTNSTLNFCAWIRFVVPGATKGVEEIYAREPREWFEKLQNDKVQRLRMSSGSSRGAELPDRISVAFAGGGGERLIETRGPERWDYWRGRWEIGDRTRTDRKIWRVSYVWVGGSKPGAEERPENLDAVKTEFKNVLEAIAQFSQEHKCEPFTNLFESALARLESQTPLQGLSCGDLVPSAFLPQSACQLLGAAEDAWVFGAMGSWNDLGLDQEPHYEELSERLYRMLNEAIVAAANSEAAPTGRK
jgi:hypothetical protein